MERKEWQEFIKRYPSQKAREAADLAVDTLDDSVTLAQAVAIWSDTYIKIAGDINLNHRK